MTVSRRSPGLCVVTGATGFVGSHLALELIRRGESVRGFVRNASLPMAAELAAAGVELFEGDITDEQAVKAALEGAETVFHAAAVLGPANLDPAVYRAVNSDAVQTVMDACGASGTVTRFVQVSTVGVLGPLPPKTRADEGTPPHPVDIYEVTKLEGEERVLSAVRNGFPAVIVRPGWVYGPGDTRTLKLFRMIARRRFMMIGKAENKQHPVFIDDLINGIILAGTTPDIEGRVYHLCGPEIPTVNELCQKIAHAAGVTLWPLRPPVQAIRMPAWLIGKLFALFGVEPPVDHRKADFFIINRAYSIQRARDDLGWIPVVPFDDGIQKTIQWYRDKGMI